MSLVIFKLDFMNANTLGDQVETQEDNLMKQMVLKRSNCIELVRNFQDLQDQIKRCRLYVVIYLPQMSRFSLGAL